MKTKGRGRKEICLHHFPCQSKMVLSCLTTMQKQVWKAQYQDHTHIKQREREHENQQMISSGTKTIENEITKMVYHKDIIFTIQHWMVCIMYTLYSSITKSNNKAKSFNNRTNSFGFANAVLLLTQSHRHVRWEVKCGCWRSIWKIDPQQIWS